MTYASDIGQSTELENPAAQPSSEVFSVACNNGTLQAYSTIRNLIEHENDLVNHRMTWLLYFNAFLFAAIALLSNATVGNGAVFKAAELLVFAFLIALLGVLTSYLALKSIQAAFDAIKALRAHWVLHFEPHTPGIVHANGQIVHYKTICDEKLPRVDGTQVFPYIVGGGPNFDTARRGRQAPSRIIGGLVLTWAFIAVYLGLRIGLLLVGG